MSTKIRAVAVLSIILFGLTGCDIPGAAGGPGASWPASTPATPEYTIKSPNKLHPSPLLKRAFVPGTLCDPNLMWTYAYSPDSKLIWCNRNPNGTITWNLVK